VYTALEKKLLLTASLVKGPVYAELLARVVKRPKRGVQNVLGKLVSKGVLKKLSSPTRYTFLSQDQQTKWRDNLSIDSRKLCYKSLHKALCQWSPDRSLPGIEVSTVHFAVNADVSKSLSIAVDAVKKSIYRIDDQLTQDLLDVCMVFWSSPDTLPPEIHELETCFLEITSGQDSCKTFTEQIIQLQDTGLTEDAAEQLKLMDEKTDLKPVERVWLCSRQKLLEGDLTAAKTLISQALGMVDRHLYRGLTAMMLLDLGKIYGISGKPDKEERCIALARYFTRNGRRPHLNRLINIRNLEAKLESGENGQALKMISRLFKMAAENGWTDAMISGCCFGLRLAARLNRPGEAFQYADELLLMVDMIPDSLVQHCRLAIEDIKSWDSNRYSKGVQLLKIRAEKTCAANTLLLKESYTVNELLFMRFSHLACDRYCHMSIEEKRPEYARDLFLKSKAIALNIEDDRRWMKTVKHLSTLPADVTDDTSADYPAGYIGWLHGLLESSHLDELLQKVRRGIQDMFSIKSASFVIERRGRWIWMNEWGDQLSTRLRRTIARKIEKGELSDVSEKTDWSLISLPDSLPYRGYFAIHLDVKNTTEAHFDETMRSMKLLIRPIAMIREALTRQSAPKSVIDGRHCKDAADRILGVSPDIRILRKQIRTVADSSTSVHIFGETGPGKELVAQAIHYCSSRKSAPFVAFNCSTSTETMIDSELFGHEKGAFTGAQRCRKGVFLSAHTGTLFLDEIADLPLSAQAKLLRVLQEKRIRPVGSDIEREIDVRIVSATHKNLEKEIAEGRFRRDLYYRVVVINLEISPLRMRVVDIPGLAHYFLQRYSDEQERETPVLSKDAELWLKSWSWPGNIRELQNLMEAAVTFSKDQSMMHADDLIMWGRISSHDTTQSLSQITKQCQREYICRILSICNGNVSRSAEKMGISRQGLFKKMKSMGILVPCDEGGFE